MKKHPNSYDHFKVLFTIGLALITVTACGRKTKPIALGAYGLNQEFASFEIQCNPPALPPPATGESAKDPLSVPLPDNLPTVQSPIEVVSCNGLAGDPPHFFNRMMPGFTTVVDCNAGLVRFRTRDWQVAETVGISGDGTVDGKVMLVTRLLKDTAGNENCWSRFLGHVVGKVRCSSDPNAIHFDYKVDWTFDETPPEVMESPSPNFADLRNGKHCKILPGNCAFRNSNSVSCGG